MCRMVGWLTTQNHDGTRWLVDESGSLLNQAVLSNVPGGHHPQKDGWGIGWFFNGQPYFFREPRKAWETREEFVTKSREARGSVGIGHVRETSGTPPSLENTQPFLIDGALLAHNGTVRKKDEVAQALLPGVRLLGRNDSEVLFRLLLKHGAAMGDPVAAFRETIHQLDAHWKAKGLGKDGKHPYTALNTLLAPSGKEIYAFCRYGHNDDVDSSGVQKTRFTDGTPKFYEMAYLATDKEVVVASEPLNKSGEWRSLDNGMYLRAQVHDGKVSYETGKIDITTGK